MASPKKSSKVISYLLKNIIEMLANSLNMFLRQFQYCIPSILNTKFREGMNTIRLYGISMKRIILIERHNHLKKNEFQLNDAYEKISYKKVPALLLF